MLRTEEPVDTKFIEYSGARRQIKVYYQEDLDGGGSWFGQDYLAYLQGHLPQGGRAFEWCCGPAFIGFSLLAAGLCDSLCLADVNPQAIRMLRKTVAENSLEDVVSIYESDCLDDIPASERWDLVVGNPPHSGNDLDLPFWGKPLIYKDPGWALHKRFFSSVGRFLNRNGRIVLQENYFCSSPDTFKAMARARGLRIRSVSPLPWPHESIYYLWLEQARANFGKSTAPPGTEAPRAVFRFDDSDQWRLEKLFREDAGFAPRPSLQSPERILRYRRAMLTSDPWTRGQMADACVELTLTGPSGGRWLIGKSGYKSILRRRNRQPTQPVSAAIRMTATMFVGLYERRMRLLHAYLTGRMQITGDLNLARVVLRALLAPSATRVTD